MKRSGTADLPLHYGHVPLWLAERMSKLGFAIVETIAMEFSTSEVISKLSNPFWFQSFGAVMGMDWHSSGITTSVPIIGCIHISSISGSCWMRC